MKHFFFYIHILITIFAYHSLLLSKKFSFLSASSFLLPPSPVHFLFLSSTSSFSTYLSSFSNLFRDPLLHFLTLTSLKFTPLNRILCFFHFYAKYFFLQFLFSVIYQLYSKILCSFAFLSFFIFFYC